MVHTVSSREFARDVAAAKKQAQEGPVVITDRGEPSHVLLTIAHYRRLVKRSSRESLLDAMKRLPSSGAADLEIPRRGRWPDRISGDFGAA